MRTYGLILLLYSLPASTWSLAHANILTFNDAMQSRLRDLILIDAGNLDACLASSVQGARCLPAQTFQSKVGELASFRDVSWAFGTADLNESDNVLVFADDSQDRDAVVGLLFLSGHKQVWRWPGTTSGLQHLLGSGSGQGRGLTRSKIYTGTMRDEFIVLPDEVQSLQNSGWSIVQPENDTEIQQNLSIATGNTPLESIALFARLLSEGHRQVKVVVDRFIIKQHETRIPWLWFSLLLISLTLLVVLISWQKNRGER